MNDEILTTGVAEETEFPAHGSLWDVFVGFWEEIFGFIKYIFYDVLLGKAA